MEYVNFLLFSSKTLANSTTARETSRLNLLWPSTLFCLTLWLIKKKKVTKDECWPNQPLRSHQVTQTELIIFWLVESNYCVRSEKAVSQSLHSDIFIWRSNERKSWIFFGVLDYLDYCAYDPMLVQKGCLCLCGAGKKWHLSRLWHPETAGIGSFNPLRPAVLQRWL